MKHILGWRNEVYSRGSRNPSGKPVRTVWEVKEQMNQ